MLSICSASAKRMLILNLQMTDVYSFLRNAALSYNQGDHKQWRSENFKRGGESWHNVHLHTRS